MSPQNPEAQPMRTGPVSPQVSEKCLVVENKLTRKGVTYFSVLPRHSKQANILHANDIQQNNNKKRKKIVEFKVFQRDTSGPLSSSSFFKRSAMAPPCGGKKKWLRLKS